MVTVYLYFVHFVSIMDYKAPNSIVITDTRQRINSGALILTRSILTSQRRPKFRNNQKIYS
jgi:hypothetical protein